MTNGEKFKTAEERQSNFNKFCKQYERCHHCPLGHPARLGICRFHWLDLEYKEELLPCPFCGSEASINSGTEDHYVVCRNDDCAAAIIARSFSSPEEAIAAWNRRAK
jgi:Lar family restriction alleviation protein